MKHSYIILLFIVLFCPSCTKEEWPEDKPGERPGKNEDKVYVINNKDFGIYSDKTNAKATTDGINKAIEQAKKEGYNVIRLTEGDYLIHCIGQTDWYPENGIFVPTNITLDLTGARLYAEPNNSAHYALIQIDHVENATVIGGHLIGDRPTHDKQHKAGHGVQVIASTNVIIRDTKIEAMTGDGIVFTTYTYMHYHGRFASKNALISGCDISDCGRQGIQVIHAEKVEITENTLYDFTGGSNQYAVDINPNGAWKSIARDVKIHHNQFPSKSGIRLWNGTDISVYENHFENTGIFCVTPERVHIHKNTLTNNGSIYIAKGSVDICAPTEGKNKNECYKVTDYSTRTEKFTCN